MGGRKEGKEGGKREEGREGRKEGRARGRGWGGGKRDCNLMERMRSPTTMKSPRLWRKRHMMCP
jgi:hypothetical protein